MQSRPPRCSGTWSLNRIQSINFKRTQMHKEIEAHRWDCCCWRCSRAVKWFWRAFACYRSERRCELGNSRAGRGQCSWTYAALSKARTGPGSRRLVEVMMMMMMMLMMKMMMMTSWRPRQSSAGRTFAWSNLIEGPAANVQSLGLSVIVRCFALIGWQTKKKKQEI